MAEFPKTSLTDAVRAARQKRGGVAVWDFDPEGARKLQGHEIAGYLRAVDRRGLQIEVMGTMARLTEAGLTPGKMVPDQAGGWLEGTQVEIGAVPDSFAIRLKVRAVD